MQKQLILCMSVPGRTTRAKYEMTAAIKEIRGVDHLICDLYGGKIKLARYVVSDKEYGKFLYLENRWSQDIKYYSYIRSFGEYEGNIFPKTAVSDETIKVLKKYGIKAPVNSTYACMVNEKMSDIYYAKKKEE
ncbi:MAG: hypothetical protein J6A59_18235, partial [Lachnospiraceae bacterium]|nr:hypothetical protein [Lachnospiraceae bacterium]